MQKLHNSDHQASKLEETFAQVVRFLGWPPIEMLHTNAWDVPRAHLGVGGWELDVGSWIWSWE
jgi:hypothetical protein